MRLMLRIVRINAGALPRPRQAALIEWRQVHGALRAGLAALPAGLLRRAVSVPGEVSRLRDAIALWRAPPGAVASLATLIRSCAFAPLAMQGTFIFTFLQPSLLEVGMLGSLFFLVPALLHLKEGIAVRRGPSSSPSCSRRSWRCGWRGAFSSWPSSWRWGCCLPLLPGAAPSRCSRCRGPSASPSCGLGGGDAVMPFLPGAGSAAPDGGDGCTVFIDVCASAWRSCSIGWCFCPLACWWGVFAVRCRCRAVLVSVAAAAARALGPLGLGVRLPR